MTALALLIGLCAVGGMFAKHASFILMHGSVFEWLRAWVRRGTKETTGRKQWMFKKLHEIFTCHLCMTTQVSIWTVALPLMTILALRYPGMLSHLTVRDMPMATEVVFFPFAWFIASIVNAAVAMAFWNLTEHLPEVKKEMERHHRTNEEAAAAMVAETERHNQSLEIVAAQQVLTHQESKTPVAFEDFQKMIDMMAGDCDGIGCGYGRRDCRVKGVEDFAKDLADRESLSYSQRTKLQRLLSRAARRFNQLRYDITGDVERADRAWEGIQSEISAL